SLAERAAEVAGTVAAAREHGEAIVLAELGQTNGDALFADAIASHLPGAFRLPAIASIEDITAAIAHARAFVATSPQGRSTALAFGVPTAPLEVNSALAIEPSVDERMRAQLEREVDAELDELAAIAARSWSERMAAGDPA